ncbi:MAG: chorismate mutase, partial [Candidatus Bathyarchaeia archaeon]
MKSKLKELREKIRVVDEEILRLICRRFKLAKQVNQVKRKLNIPVIDYAVEREVIDHAIKISRQQGLRSEFTSSIVQLLLAESVRV